MTAIAITPAAPTIDTDIGAHMRRPVVLPLNRLFLSTENVRKQRDLATVPALAAMIEAHGLLYPLVVIVERTTIDGSEVEGWAW